ncbi:hypothetical protein METBISCDRAFT_17114 [Metschnikowia bicuspidata]|uniref:tRNA ligase n=1 Tax=Metschnikowia bicuspidata TaxID=27322 RepID=A0A4P9ZB92_9ASCO|nr:hypothetical protein METBISCDRAFT_17114 [Metschnikowia bicuspidata]
MVALDEKEDFDNLITDLERLLRTLRSSDEIVQSSVRGQRRVTHKRYKVTTTNGPVHIDNWKFPEFDFARKYDSMPCHARGLFTSSNAIVARGYDKFFNIDEFQMVKLETLERECEGQFIVSTKENGCIMFFAGLPDSTLLVCSKNLTGDLESDRLGKLKHYEQGIVDIIKQLQKIGKTTHDLAKELYTQGLTAVAELCDDSYEEHIIPYPPTITGLYLHGLNYNKKSFETRDMASVSDFADAWGFRKVSYTSFETYQSLISYMSAAAALGKHEGREIEGFVIRCKRAGKDFFFKYKFEQPYFLYRQFREATLKLFSTERKRNIREVLSTYSKFKRITLAYLEFAQDYFAKYPEAQEEFHKNIGIIKLRQKFLTLLGYSDDQGMELLAMENNELLSTKLELLLQSTRTVYCVSTIAYPGCGKTTTCMTLSSLFPDWSHVQNDNYPNAKVFYGDIVEHLVNGQLVFVDRMNYRLKYRQELFNSISLYRENAIPDVEIKHIGINFMRSQDQDTALELSKGRILKRGDNHQSVKAESSKQAALALLRDCARNFERPQLKSDDILPISVEGSELKGYDSGFDFLINVDVNSDELSLQNAKIIYQELGRRYPDLRKGEISENQLQGAYQAARDYEPAFVKNVSRQSTKAVYYGIRVDRESIVGHLNEILHESKTWQLFKQNSRIQELFHVTLAHAQSSKKSADNLEVWNMLGRHFAVSQMRKSASSMELKPVEVYADLTLEKIVVVENILIAIKVSSNKFYKSDHGRFAEILNGLRSTNEHLHITIGTRDPAIRPLESNTYLCEIFKNGEPAWGEYKGPDFTATIYDLQFSLDMQQCFIYFQ